MPNRQSPDQSVERTSRYERDYGHEALYGGVPWEPRLEDRPKGYKRSDESIREDACERLRDHSFIDASEIEVSVDDGEVQLAGTVADRRVKRLAEDVVEQVAGVHDVHNRLRIKRGA